MKKLKKLLAVLCAGTMVFSSMTVFAAQDTTSLADGTAYLNINNSDWSEFDAEWTNAEITGDGSYTVAMEATEGQALVQFNALEVVNGESVLGTGCVLTVDSIKINGEEVEMTGSSYTCSADGGGVTTRVNIYNEWNTPDATATAGDDKHLDCRVAEGSVEDASATLFDASYVDASSGSGFLVESIEVNFTVSGYGTEGETGSAGAVTLMEGPAIAHLNLNNADWSEFEAEYVDAEITGDGTYTVSMTATEGQSLVQFNALEVENGELIMGNGTVLTVDSIKINGEEVELAGPSYTCSADGGGVTTRVNLYNEWNTPDSTATAGDDNHLDCRVAEGSVDDATAMLFSSDYVDASSGSGFLVESMEVTFTVSSFGTGTAGTEAEPLSADLDGTYHAYVMIQGPKYTFRDAYDNSSTGYGTDLFNQVTYQGDTAEGTSVAATINDVEIAGNGTYVASIIGIEWPEDEFSDQEYMNIIALSTDIPNSGEITISDIKLIIDGNEIKANELLNEESVDYAQYILQSVYNDEASSAGYYAVPFSDISISFTVSGMNYDNADATGAVEESAATEVVEEAPVEEASSSNTGVIVAVVIVVVVVAVVAYVVVSKKKKDGASK